MTILPNTGLATCPWGPPDGCCHAAGVLSEQRHALSGIDLNLETVKPPPLTVVRLSATDVPTFRLFHLPRSA